MVRLFLFALLVFLAACGGGSTESAAIRSVAIEGDRRFVQQITRALELLQSEAPEAFQLVHSYVGKIQQSPRSGMWAWKDPPTMTLADRTAHSSVTWCAGAIVHEAYHSMLYHSYKAANGVPVPQDVWTGVEIERRAIGRQITVMVALGAPNDEIGYLGNLDGTHNDITGDGAYTWEDYDLVDW